MIVHLVVLYLRIKFSLAKKYNINIKNIINIVNILYLLCALRNIIMKSCNEKIYLILLDFIKKKLSSKYYSSIKIII